MDSTQTVRAKFRVRFVEPGVVDGQGVTRSEHVALGPVTDDGGAENRAFWTATPSGNLEMWISNPGVFGFFKDGQEVYLDFHPVV